MYTDGRAAGLAVRLNAVAGEFTARHGYRFKDDFALAKLLWLRDHDPAFARAAQCLHQSDFVNARLAGGFVATDWSSALKTGCDLFRGAWPEALFGELGVPLEKLPGAVVAPGARLGAVCAAAAAATGLRPGTVLVAGATDGTASLFGSGACRPGDFNTSLGSTLILKGISREVIHDPRGVMYCHRHPAGDWLPGGAGNVGCAALNREFAPDPATRRAVLATLDATVDAHLPSATLVYPLGDATEERFPFKRTGIRTLYAGPRPASREAAYAAVLQGIACVERWCYDELAALGAPALRVFSTGGGSRSEVWCRLRASVLGRPLLLPQEAETALGAAVLAAGHLRGDLASAAADMVRIRRTVEPSGQDFAETYAAFRAAVRTEYGL
jgi:sugar (pentulose or hexulose) kinase